jgi:hypothetical protein
MLKKKCPNCFIFCFFFNSLAVWIVYRIGFNQLKLILFCLGIVKMIPILKATCLKVRLF